MILKTNTFFGLLILCLSSSEAIEIKVATYKEKVATYEINSSEKIIDLKTKIEITQDIEIQDQELYLNTIRLDNEKRIDHYVVNEGATFTLYVIAPDDDDGDKWKNDTVKALIPKAATI